MLLKGRMVYDTFLNLSTSVIVIPNSLNCRLPMYVAQFKRGKLLSVSTPAHTAETRLLTHLRLAVPTNKKHNHSSPSPWMGSVTMWGQPETTARSRNLRKGTQPYHTCCLNTIINYCNLSWSLGLIRFYPPFYIAFNRLRDSVIMSPESRTGHRR